MEIKRIRLFTNDNSESLKVEEKIISKLKTNKFTIVDDLDFDLGIAIGGDGSFLRMVNESNFKNDCLYVGINVGTLGFAQDISVDEIDSFIDEIKRGDFFYEEIGIQDVEVKHNGLVTKFNCLNEIVIRNEDLSLLHMNVLIDNELLEEYAGDGLLISTSFGSSAYNLSFGGSLVYNEFDTLQITPIAPIKNKVYQTLTNSLILPANKLITITSNIDNNLIITVDGRNNVFENIVEINTSIVNHIKVIRKNNYNYIKKINDKFIK